MDANVQRLLGDKLYEKRKAGALELESSIRTALAEENDEQLAKIVHQLCHNYAYAVHQPHARNGGLIGLAAAAIALGSEVARFLNEIVPPVLACFGDQDARVRYYACESMYNICKVAKGEVLIYFNHIFDALCKLSADPEPSVKNGAELLDRLVKDIVSESAATYASIIVPDPEPALAEAAGPDWMPHAPVVHDPGEPRAAFSLPAFIPLLEERIHVINPYTRTFLVSWITLLDSVPDLELAAYLPSFLPGLLRFLSDSNPDVHTTTKAALDRFLAEIKLIAAINKETAGNGRTPQKHSRKSSWASNHTRPQSKADSYQRSEASSAPRSQHIGLQNEHDAAVSPSKTAAAINGNDPKPRTSEHGSDEHDGDADGEDATDSEDNDDDDYIEDEWTPGQDVQIDYRHILDILVTFLADSSEEELQLTTLTWIESFFDICPEDILAFTPSLLAQVLPALSHDVDRVKQAAQRVNQALRAYIAALPEDMSRAGQEVSAPVSSGASSQVLAVSAAKASGSSLPNRQGTRKLPSPEQIGAESVNQQPTRSTTVQGENDADEGIQTPLRVDLDYEAAVNSLTQQFLHSHESTRVAALAWLIMLHNKSPRKILAIQDATFPALLQTLSDPAESVVTRDLVLLSQISKSSDDSYFTSFMVNLLKLFRTDRRLLEMRGNLIIRQLCLSLSAEKIYRTMADCLEKDEEDVEFAATMVQNLNNNLMTAPELQDLRKRLRNLENRDGQTFFTALFRAWCDNAVATFSLCLLAQAYEQAYNLLQIFADLEMTVHMLIQIDKLVQLLESPVFTYLRMQLLEPERFPYLYKCLYGLLMLLPQSSAFAALKNRLNSVSAIGYLHIAPRNTSAPSTASTVSNFERQNRLKSRDEGGIRWTELLDKFRQTQDGVRRAQFRQMHGYDGDALEGEQGSGEKKAERKQQFAPQPGSVPSQLALPDRSKGPSPSPGPRSLVGAAQSTKEQPQGSSRPRSGLSHLGRLTKGVGKKIERK